jgi:hypothetical protein
LQEFVNALANSENAHDISSDSSSSSDPDESDDEKSDTMVVFSRLRQPNWKAWVDGVQSVLSVDVMTRNRSADLAGYQRVVAVDLRPRDGFPDQRYLSFQVSPMRMGIGSTEYRSEYFKLSDREIGSTVEKSGDHHWSFSLFDFMQATQPKRKRAVKRPRED